MKPNPPSILCATDFSERASDTATVAAKFAVRRSQPLRLVYAYEPRNVVALTAARRRLEREALRLRELGATVEASLLEGFGSADLLLDHIRATQPGLVVVSSSVKGPMDRWALGSFSERIAESSPVPTLIIRDTAAFDGWDWSKGKLRILAALDLNSTSDVVLRWVKETCRTSPCDVLACYHNYRMPTVAEAAEPPGNPKNPPALQRQLERALQKKVRDQLGEESAGVVVKPIFGDPGPGIIETARQVKAHLIAVGTHQRHGLRRLARFSVSRALLHESAMNVVCVPVTAKFDPKDAHIPDFRRVLVATDFSELGNAAVPFACAACPAGGLVRIVHVARTSDAGGRSSGLRAKLRELIPNEMAGRGQPPEVEVLEGRDVAAAIGGEAERFGADLVCVASHGLGASRALHGSITKALLKKIRRPLLVIRRPEE